MDSQLVEQDWEMVLTRLPADLEATAASQGALIRKRQVKSAAALLRLALAYAFCGFSLRVTAAWAAKVGLARFSDVALLKRLRHAGPWLQHLLTQILAERVPLLRGPVRDSLRGLRVRLIDATSVSRPGSAGTDWRVHLGFDLERLCIDHAQLTEASGGETFTRHPAQPGELLIGDRGYAHRAGIAALAKADTQLIVRLNWQNVPLQQADGTPFNLLGAARALSTGTVGEWEVQTTPDPGADLPAVPGRVIAIRKHPDAVERERRRIRRTARKKGKTPDARTLEAAAFTFLFTTLTPAQLSAADVLELYRFRWQIELAFKRLKSLLALDELAAHDPELCRTALLAKLIGALLVEDLASGWLAFSPWGYGLPVARLRLAAVPTPEVAAATGDPGSAAAVRLARPRRRHRPPPARTSTPQGPAGHGGPQSTSNVPLSRCLS